MSEEQLKAFLEKVKDDTGLQGKLNAATDADAVLAIAKEVGFVISTDDLKDVQSESSDDELESAAGGTQRVEFPMMRVRSFTAGQIFVRNDPENPSKT